MRKPVHFRQGNGRPVEEAARALAPAAALASSPVPALASFARDILPMFTPFASAMMWRLDLTNYEAVMGNAETIHGRISSTDSPMPPPPFPMLTAAQIQLFEKWMKDGCQP